MKRWAAVVAAILALPLLAACQGAYELWLEGDAERFTTCVEAGGTYQSSYDENTFSCVLAATS